MSCFARRRGQATVETALGVLAFVTLLTVGIHFAEVGYLSLKVQEAATTALWDATGPQPHRLNGLSFTPEMTTAINVAKASAQSRCNDFDCTTVTTNGATLTQLFTQASNLQVHCQLDGAIFPWAPATNLSYQDIGGVSCYADASLDAWKIPRNFLDQGSNKFFPTANYSAPTTLQVCSTGRALWGGCSNQNLSVLLDDWGLQNTGNESAECPVLPGGGCTNMGYYTLVQNGFNAYPKGSGGALAMVAALLRSVPGGSPDPTTFWMSYRGEESSFQETENGGDQDPNNWTTSPGRPALTETQYATAYGSRSPCFLGIRCN